MRQIENALMLPIRFVTTAIAVVASPLAHIGIGHIVIAVLLASACGIVGPYWHSISQLLGLPE